MDKTRIIVFFVFVGFFMLAYQIGSMASVSEEQAMEFMDEFEAVVSDIDAFGIFTHNTAISLPMFVPGFGVAWGLFSAWSTGFAFSAISVTNPDVQQIPAITILFSPFGMMELVAYSLGVSRSFILIRAITKKVNLIQFIKPSVIEIAMAVGLLLAGGYLEFYMIESHQASMGMTDL